jgi:tryptophanyl-tRNA synthetase
VLSGIQPNGALHLGNYFGAIRQHIALQDTYPGQALYFIADYHALTTIHDAEVLRGHVFDVALTYLALGLDPSRTLLFRQSDIPEVPELTWLLATVTGMGLLERAHAYKDKLANGITPSVGLFLYPVLMAADILAYDATLVPVGKDQVQHIEMAQDMVTHFNEGYAHGAPVLVRPEPLVQPEGRRRPRHRRPQDEQELHNTLPIFETGKKLRKLVGQIVTDSTPLGQPLPFATCNVVALLRLLSDDAELAQIETWYRAAPATAPRSATATPSCCSPTRSTPTSPSPAPAASAS